MNRGIVFLVLGAMISTAQAQYTDIGGWAGLTLEQKVKKDWSWSLKWENRWSMAGTWHDRGFVNAGVAYKLNKMWSAEAQWRWVERQRDAGFYESVRRFAVRLDGKAKRGPGQWKWRLMTTKAWNPMTGMEGNAVSEDLVQRFRLGYAWSPSNSWSLVPSYEVFMKDMAGGSAELSSRFQLQLKREINKQWTVGTAYVWSDEWQSADPWDEHVIRLNVTWQLPDVKGKDRKGKGRKKTIPPARVYSSNGKRWSPQRQSVGRCNSAQIYLSEVHAKGDPADYIEVRNAAQEPCDLEGWELTDNQDQPGLVFGTMILPSGGCWLGYESGKGSFSFGISAESEIIYLKIPSGEVRSWTLPLAEKKRSVSFDMLGNNWFSEPSPGSANPDDSSD